MKRSPPDVFKFDQIVLFLDAYFEFLKSENHKLSHRLFAKKVGWPISFLADVLAKRRKLTVSRCIQLCQALKFDALTTERCLYMCLHDVDQPNVRDYFKSRLDLKVADQRFETTPHTTYLFKNIVLLAVRAAIKTAGKILTPDQLKEVLYTFPNFERNDYKYFIDELISKNVIQIKDGTLVDSGAQIHLDEHDQAKPLGTTRFLENTLRYFQNPRGPSIYNSGFITIDKRRFNEVATKVMTARNWLLDLSHETTANQDVPYTERMILQFDLNLIPIINGDLWADPKWHGATPQLPR